MKAPDETLAKLFTVLQEKGAVWIEKEREGLVQIEAFQAALGALREAQRGMDTTQHETGLTGLAGNVAMNPWLAEDLYPPLQELARGFEDLVDEMYTLQEKARAILVERSTEEQDQDVASTKLRPVDYFQMMNQELATFEAEFQHIEALLRQITFDTTMDELRALGISWSTSPFLDPAQSRRFAQRHQISERRHKVTNNKLVD